LCVARFAACNNIFYIENGHKTEFLRRRERPLGRLRAPVLVPLADLHPRTRQVREPILVALMPIPAALDQDLRTRPTDQPPFSGTILNLPPAMISWYQDRAFLLPAEGLFQDRDRLVLSLPSAS
jgi:hypothetical protein